MTAPVADTIGNDIIEDINALIRTGRFADPASLEVRRLKVQIEKLKKVNAKFAYRCSAALSQACGNEAEMRNNHKRVRDLGSELRNFTDEMTGLCNLGYITDSHTLSTRPQKQITAHSASWLTTAGTFWHLMHSLPMQRG